MSILKDREFGNIKLRRSRLSRHIRLRIDQRGQVSISLPLRAPLFLAKNLLEKSRESIRRSLKLFSHNQTILRDGDLIGKTHKLVIVRGNQKSSKLVGTNLEIALPEPANFALSEIQAYIKQAALKALRTQAKAYLSRRLQQLALNNDFSYKKLRFTNAGTRWGSCSSSGTISLNIWLMQLPFELIDYVILHELCHTKQMNHSPVFWQLVANLVPNYKDLRRKLRTQKPL